MYLRKRADIIIMQLSCYHCCHTIDGKPLGLPYSKTEGGVFKCYGNFCSYPCMKTYTLELNDSYKSERFTLISEMNYISTGSTGGCKFAPRREQLKMFGGQMSIEEFRGSSMGTSTLKLIPPMEPVTVIFDKYENFSLKKNNESINQENVTNEPIKLQRAKPLTNSQNTLEVTMGLFKHHT